MVSIKRTSQSEQTLLKYYSLKINRLGDTEKKNCQTKGSCQFLISYDYKRIIVLLGKSEFSYLLLLFISL